MEWNGAVHHMHLNCIDEVCGSYIENSLSIVFGYAEIDIEEGSEN